MSATAGVASLGAGGLADNGVNRRHILAGLAALAGTSVVGSMAAKSTVDGLSQVGTVAAGASLLRGGMQRFNAPMLAPGAQVNMPAGVQGVAVEGFFVGQPRLVGQAQAWPAMPVTGGATVDASQVPEKGAASRMAVLSGFSEGHYSVVHPNGKVDRVEWDVEKFPYLLYWGEFGAWKELPFHGQFFTLGLEPFSHPPVK